MICHANILKATLKERRKLIVSRIKAARESRGLTQREVAEMIGTHRPTLSLLERGGQALTVEMLLKLANVLDYSPGYLLAVDCDTVDHLIPRETGNLKVLGSVPWPAGKPTDLGTTH